MSDFAEKAELIKKQARETSLFIGRLPKKYKTKFMEIATKEFEDDYGMCLREMIRTWEGIYVEPDVQLSSKIDVLADEINQIKIDIATLQEKPEVVRRKLSGKVISKKKEQEE